MSSSMKKLSELKRVFEPNDSKYADFLHCTVKVQSKAGKPGKRPKYKITEDANWAPRAVGVVYDISQQGDLDGITHGTCWEIYVKGKNDPYLIPVDEMQSNKWSTTPKANTTRFFQFRVPAPLFGAVGGNDLTIARQQVIDSTCTSNVFFCSKKYGCINVSDDVRRQLPDFPKHIFYLGTKRVYDMTTCKVIDAKQLKIIDNFSSSSYMSSKHAEDSRLLVDPADCNLTYSDSVKCLKDIVEQISISYTSDAFSALSMLFTMVLSLAGFYSLEEGQVSYDLAFPSLYGVASSGKTRISILVARMLGIKCNAGYRSLMVSSGTKEGFYKLASNWVNLPLILDNTQKKRAQGQELLRYMYDGGAVQAARARGQRALELRAPLVTIGSNPFFDLQDVKLTAADREQFLFVPFSSRVEDTETLLKLEKIAPKCTPALLGAAKYLKENGRLLIEKHLNQLGTQDPYTKRGSYTMAGFAAARDALIEVIGTDSALNNDVEFFEFVNVVRDANNFATTGENM